MTAVMVDSDVTGRGVLSRVTTDLAVLDVAQAGFDRRQQQPARECMPSPA
ncbi:MAG: hypothetical protein QOJ95_988 [Mycobacterium sp.]|jgi:hypothetical protein|nr:hypothetical protein [Mycobacterium sp.]